MLGTAHQKVLKVPIPVETRWPRPRAPACSMLAPVLEGSGCWIKLVYDRQNIRTRQTVVHEASDDAHEDDSAAVVGEAFRKLARSDHCGTVEKLVSACGVARLDRTRWKIGRTVGAPREGVGDAAESVLLLLGGELEAVMDAVEFVVIVGCDHVVSRDVELLLENVGCCLGLSEAADGGIINLQACHVVCPVAQ